MNAIPQEGRSAFTAMLSTVPAQTEELEEQQRGQRSGDGLSQKLSRDSMAEGLLATKSEWIARRKLLFGPVATGKDHEAGADGVARFGA